MVGRIAVQECTGQGRLKLVKVKITSVRSRWGFRLGLRLLCLSLVLLNSACTSMNISPRDHGMKQIRSAGMTAAQDPMTWVPMATALLIGATDTDHKISNWATEHHPVYGSQSAAQDASDRLRTALAGSALVTSLAAPGNRDALLPGRTGSLATAAMAAATTSQFTGALKDSTGRTRPNDVDQRSFPSSHSAAASTYATISAQRANALPLSLGQRRTLQTGFHVIAAATAWARVEAQAHYPIDVLIGFALGNFTAVLFNEALQRPQRPVWVGIDRDRNYDTFLLNLRIAF